MPQCLLGNNISLRICMFLVIQVGERKVSWLRVVQKE